MRGTRAVRGRALEQVVREVELLERRERAELGRDRADEDVVPEQQVAADRRHVDGDAIVLGAHALVSGADQLSASELLFSLLVEGLGLGAEALSLLDQSASDDFVAATLHAFGLRAVLGLLIRFRHD